MAARAGSLGVAFAARTLRRQLVHTLRSEGALTEPDWISAFHSVPRHAFLENYFLPSDDGWMALTRGDGGWLDHIYADNVLVTQLDGDPRRWGVAREHGPIAGVPTSSSSMPSIMAIMLEELLVGEQDTVLEIGTGTGYNTALLCERLGSAQVSTVDVDEAIAAMAQSTLERCGYRPAYAVSDGADGFAERAPFDRVLLTCSVSRVPLALLAQTKPGGYLVTTLNRPIGAGLLRLTADGSEHGHGRVLPDDGRFMPLRAHRLDDATTLLERLEPPTTRAGEPTSIPASAVVNPSSPFEFFAGLVLPGVVPALGPEDDSTYLLHGDGSWACHYPERGGFAVDQGGPRTLWDDVERAYALWQELGKPTRSRFGVSVTSERQELWLDRPRSPYRWPL